MRRIIATVGVALLAGLTLRAGLPAGPGLDGLPRAQYAAIPPRVVLEPIQQLVASSGVAYEQFGTAVALDGDVAVVGATGASGVNAAAYVFRRVDGAWVQEACFTTRVEAGCLTVDDAGMMSDFGKSVGVSGQTVVVGAPRANDWRGLAYVFVSDGTTWARQARLEAADGASGDTFGESVAVDGDRVAVGAPGATVDARWGQGAVHVFARSATTWMPDAKLSPADGAENDHFGRGVALDGNNLVGGAPGDTVAGADQAGSARVFRYTGAVWAERGTLTAPAPAAYEQLGASVAIDGNTVVAGATGVYVDMLAGAGAVDVFGWSGLAWLHRQRLVSSVPAQYDQFGHAVGVSGSTLVVGTPIHTVGANSGQGTVDVFIHDGTAWSDFRRLQVSDGVSWDQLGTGVAIDERTIVAGAPGRDVDANEMQGAGYVFALPPVVFDIAPTVGSTAGGTVVSVGGLHFAPDAALTFGATAATDVTVWSPGLISARTPAHAAGAADVTVTTPDGGRGTLAGGFAFVTPPTITTVTPAFGPVTGNTTITIAGTGFEPDPLVTVGGHACTDVAGLSATLVTARVPAHEAGTVAVVLANTNGLRATLEAGYTYLAPPTVTGVTPASGPTTGSTSVTISGTGFHGSAAVEIGGAAATSVIVDGATTLRARTPAHAAGPVSVVVKNPDGQQGTLSPGFTYTSGVTITSISPSTIDAGTGVTLTIRGAGFGPTETILFGGARAEGTGADPTELLVDLPPHGAGTFTVGIWRADQMLWVPADQPLVFRPAAGHEQEELVDPTYFQPDQFGASTVLAGDRLFVGDPGHPFDVPRAPGRVQVYVRSGTAWAFEATITPSDSGGGDLFGTAMASDGTRLVVGAPGHPSGGAVFVFERTAGWVQTGLLTAGGEADSGCFGQHLAVSGSRILVGAPCQVGAEPPYAAVYTHGAAGWQLEGTLHGAANQATVSDVVIDGTVAAIGYEFREEVRVFELQGAAWLETAVLTPPESALGWNGDFGKRLALSGPRILVGAPLTHTGLSQSGAGYLFERAGSSWSLIATFVPRDPEVRESFGSTVALTDRFVVLGAVTQLGAAAYVLTGPGSGESGSWEEAARLLASVSGDGMPESLAAEGGTIAVGHGGCYRNVTADIDNGCVRLFTAAPSVGHVTPAIGPAEGGTTLLISGQFFRDGASVAFDGTPAGTVTFADGWTLAAVTPPHAPGVVEVAVTVPGEDPVVLQGGFVYVPSPTLTSIAPDHGRLFDWITVTGTGFSRPVLYLGQEANPADHTFFTGSTTIQAQVWTQSNGWGFVDTTVVNPDGGRATLRDGFRLDPPDGAPGTLLVPPATWDGTLEGLDAQGTLAVLGGTGAPPPWPTAGRAFVFRRRDGRWRFEEAFAAPGGSRLFGVSGATDGAAVAVGDVLPDNSFDVHVYEQTAGVWRRAARIRIPGAGYRPIAMDAGRLVAGATEPGEVHIYARGPRGWTRTYTLGPPDGAGEGYGRAVAVDGAWLAVGADTSVTTVEQVAGAWLPRTVITSPLANGGVFGHAVALEDTTLAVGAPGDNPSGEAGRGSVFIFERRGSSWAQTAHLIAPDGRAGDEFGDRVHLHGRWLAVLAPGVDDGALSRGAVYLYERGSDGWQLSGRVVPWDIWSSFGAGVAVCDQDLLVRAAHGMALYPLPPVVVGGVHPAQGPAAGGTVVTIGGQHFEAGSTVTVGGVGATNVTVVDATTLTARVPAHASGVVDVVVRHPNGLSGTLAGGYTYRDVDLVVTALSAVVALGPGATGNVGVTTRNNGPGATPKTATAVYLSANATVDANDVLLGIVDVPALLSGKTFARTLFVTIPADTAAGAYSLIAVADVRGEVGEKLETNNTRTKALTVGCDLIVSAVTAPLSAVRGTKITVTATTKNTGPGRAPASVTRVYASADAVIDKDDLLLLEHAVVALNLNATSKGTVLWTVPAGLPPGRIYILGRADATGIVPEKNESNNVKSKAITVR